MSMYTRRFNSSFLLMTPFLALALSCAPKDQLVHMGVDPEYLDTECQRLWGRSARQMRLFAPGAIATIGVDYAPAAFAVGGIVGSAYDWLTDNDTKVTGIERIVARVGMLAGFEQSAAAHASGEDDDKDGGLRLMVGGLAGGVATLAAEGVMGAAEFPFESAKAVIAGDDDATDKSKGIIESAITAAKNFVA